MGDTKRNFCTEQRAQFEVNVRGPKDKGTMFFWAERPPTADGNEAKAAEWRVNRLELEVGSIPDRRLVVRRAIDADGAAGASAAIAAVA